MVEILGGNLDQAFKELNIDAKKTYESNTYFDDKTQVWELSEEDYERICHIDDEFKFDYSKTNWKDEWGWWRGAKGSNLGSVFYRYNINNHYLYAFDGASRERFEEENIKLPKEDRWFEERKYKDLLTYIVDEIGASTEKNVTAICIDLAKQNGITLGELFRKYQG